MHSPTLQDGLLTQQHIPATVTVCRVHNPRDDTVVLPICLTHRNNSHFSPYLRPRSSLSSPTYQSRPFASSPTQSTPSLFIPESLPAGMVGILCQRFPLVDHQYRNPAESWIGSLEVACQARHGQGGACSTKDWGHREWRRTSDVGGIDSSFA